MLKVVQLPWTLDVKDRDGHSRRIFVGAIIIRPGKSDPNWTTRTEQPGTRLEPTWERVELISTRNPKLNWPKTEPTRNCNDPKSDMT